jgi:hypothetical protein
MRAVPSAAAIAPKGRPQPAGVTATVSRAPANAADTLEVEWTSIDEEDGDERQIAEECMWVRRGTTLPSIGDHALLLLDTVGDPWALVW